MIRIADIREWRTHDVIDAGGHKIGTLEAVYVDTSTDEPAMATVQVGLPTRHHLVFVPLDGAIAGPGYVKVSHDKSLVKKCPAIGTDDVLPAEDEAAVFAHYGLPYQPGTNGERQLARR
ncbi:photosystem reaction center subunit H [Streptomyces venezuelae]|uniref:PRC-barrel domain-containing protein n=1 Tax=Streptomyces venezuelae TaxID=54571 RepID=UPI00123D93CB|nr:PRC-barrel domain-containing protein [Streptomyces venezuelae]QES15087.1 photosystem reaction center subunit H [Streptomyces venezuelae]